MNIVTETIESVAGADDPALGRAFGYGRRQTSSAQRIGHVRGIIKRFLEELPDESLTVHDLRRALEDGE